MGLHTSNIIVAKYYVANKLTQLTVDALSASQVTGDEGTPEKAAETVSNIFKKMLASLDLENSRANDSEEETY